MRLKKTCLPEEGIQRPLDTNPGKSRTFVLNIVVSGWPGWSELVGPGELSQSMKLCSCQLHVSVSPARLSQKNSQFTLEEPEPDSQAHQMKLCCDLLVADENTLWFVQLALHLVHQTQPEVLKEPGRLTVEELHGYLA